MGGKYEGFVQGGMRTGERREGRSVYFSNVLEHGLQYCKTLRFCIQIKPGKFATSIS